MDDLSEKIEFVDVVYAVEGQRKVLQTNLKHTATVREFAVVVATQYGLAGEIDVFVEDADGPLDQEQVLATCLTAKFKPLHVATRGHIRVTVEYNGQKIEDSFRSGATVRAVISWAIGLRGFNLDGGPGDFQIKSGQEVVPADVHLGQLAHGSKELVLWLVFKIKQQG